MPPPQPPPAWLTELGRVLKKIFGPVGRFVDWLGSLLPDAPYARIFLWLVLLAAAIALALALFERLRHGSWRMPFRFRRRGGGDVEEAQEELWEPDAAPVRAWLDEADALAREGRFAEAVRHLLFRSIEDVAARRPRLVRPALTSRELAAAPGLPEQARQLFARIAATVERSLFGGRPVDAAEWSEARAAYADLVAPRAWRA